MMRKEKNRIIIFGMAAVLMTSVMTSCGQTQKDPDKKISELSKEETSEFSGKKVSEFAGGKKEENQDQDRENTESASRENTEIQEEETEQFEADGWSRVPNNSVWNGSYYREDGKCITVYDTDEDYVFVSYLDDNDQSVIDILQFLDAEKMHAVSATQQTAAFYTLSSDTLSVDFGSSNASLLQGKYNKRKNASCWKKEVDGTYRYMDETGHALSYHMTPDGWYVDGDGRKVWQIGMMLICSGLYESMPAYSEREGYETWSFDLYTGEDGSAFFDSPEERIEVGTVDYTVYDQEMNPYYWREELYVYNSGEGYVIEDASGQEFAWFYPAIHGNDLMIQMYGTTTYHTVRLLYDYSDFGG